MKDKIKELRKPLVKKYADKIHSQALITSGLLNDILTEFAAELHGLVDELNTHTVDKGVGEYKDVLMQFVKYLKIDRGMVDTMPDVLDEVTVDDFIYDLIGENTIKFSTPKPQEVCPKCNGTGRCAPATLDSPDGQECDCNPKPQERVKECKSTEWYIDDDNKRKCAECDCILTPQYVHNTELNKED